MSIRKLDNAAYLAQNWKDETTSKNSLKKGMNNIGFLDNSGIIIKADSSVDISGNIYYTDSDENTFISYGNIIYLVTRLGETANITLHDGDTPGVIDTIMDVTVIRDGTPTVREVVKIEILSDFPGNTAVTTSQSWDGCGFSIISGDQERYIWFDITDGVTPYGYSLSSPPPWVLDSAKDILINYSSSGSVVNSSSILTDIYDILKELKPIFPSFSLSSITDTITITRNSNMTEPDIVLQDLGRTPVISVNTTQQGSTTLPEISTVTILDDFPGGFQVATSQDWDGQGFVIYRQNIPIAVWFDILHGGFQIGYTPESPPPWVQDVLDAGGLQRYFNLDSAGVVITISTILTNIDNLLGTIDDIIIPEPELYFTMNYLQTQSYLTYDGDIFSSTDTLNWDSSKNGYYVDGTNQRIIGYYDGIEIKPIKNRIGIQDELIVQGDGNITGSVEIDGSVDIGGIITNSDLANTIYLIRQSVIGNSELSQTKIVASDAQAGDQFGSAISISGDYIIVGAPSEDTGGTDAGAAYIYRRTGINTWDSGTKIVAPTPTSFGLFGNSVDIYEPSFAADTYAIVFSAGTNTATVFREIGTNTWDSGVQLITTGTSTTNLRNSVGIYGDYAIVGDNKDDTGGTDAGAAYIFYRTGTNTWDSGTKIVAPDAEAGDEFGSSVSIYGDYAIVGANKKSGSGAAYVYRRTGTNTWDSGTKIVASDATAGDEFGSAVSISGDYAIVGAYGRNFRGAAYIFYRTGTNTWDSGTKLTIKSSTTLSGAQFGWSVDISSNMAIVGANNESASGAAYLYRRTGTNTWDSGTKIISLDLETSDALGSSVSIYDDYAIAGAKFEDAGGSSAGAAYIFPKLPQF